jgi:hypothetical protein
VIINAGKFIAKDGASIPAAIDFSVAVAKSLHSQSGISI